MRPLYDQLLRARPSLYVEGQKVTYLSKCFPQFDAAEIRAISYRRDRRGFGEQSYIVVEMESGDEHWLMEQTLSANPHDVGDRLMELKTPSPPLNTNGEPITPA